MHFKVLYQCVQHCDAKRADRGNVSKHCDAKCPDRRSVSNIASCSADCAETSIFEEANVRSSCRHRSELQRRQRSTIHLQTRVEGTRLLPTNIASSSANSAASSFNQRQRYECPADKRSELQRRQRSAAMHIHLQVLTRGKDTKLLLTHVANCRRSNSCLRRLVPHLVSAQGPARAQPTQLEPKWLYGVWKRCGCQRAFPNTATRTALTGAAFPNTDRKCADGRSVSKHCDATCAIYIYINICLYLSWYL